MYVGFCTFWYPVAILCNCVRHADQMFLSRRTFVRARGPKTIIKSLNLWIRNNNHGGVSNHQPRGCLLNFLFRSRWKKTSKHRVTGLCAVNSPGQAQRASNAENVSIWCNIMCEHFLCSYLYSNDSIRFQICTCHECSTIFACVNLNCNLIKPLWNGPL